MTVTTYWFVIAAALVAVLTSITIWSRRALPVKFLALACATAVLPLSYLSMNDILSRPKPVLLETVHNDVEQVQVISSLMQEDKAIYLWLQLPGVDEPRSYQLPWSDEAARELHKAMQEAEKSGTEVKMKKPFEVSVDNQEPVFYASPPAPPPLKDVVDDKPILFTSKEN